MITRSKSNHYLTTSQREFIFTTRQKGNSHEMTKTQFQTEFHKPTYNSTIDDICNKVMVTGSVADLPKSGRRTIYTDRECRRIVRAALKDRTKSIRDLTADPDVNPKGACFETIRSILVSNSVVSRILPKRMEDLNKANLKDRRAFAKRHIEWDVSDWNLIIFSDEADLFPVKCGKEYVRLREGEKLVDVVPVRAGYKKNLTVKVWGSISSLGVGPLIRYEKTMNASKYINLLNRHLLRFYPELEDTRMEEEVEAEQLPPFCFMQDNSTSHTAKIVQNWGLENDVNFLKWPSNSPDLNIIENIWAYIQDRLYEAKAQLTCPDDTWEKVCEIWDHIPLTYIQDLYEDLPLRMQELKLMKGGPISH